MIPGEHEHRYWFCGFVLTSDRPLPELDTVRCGIIHYRPEGLISIQVGGSRIRHPEPSAWFMAQNLPNGCPWSARARTEAGYFLRFHELADFLVDTEGRSVSCVARHPGVSDLTVRALLLDHVLPPVIALRGGYVLHAAAVQTAAGACVFAGDSGAGKSTIAARLAMAGCDFLGDDCLVIDERGGAIMARSSHPSMKLRADVMQFLNPACDGEPVADYTSKKRLQASSFGGAAPIDPVPVVRFYFLNREDREKLPIEKPLVERLPSHAAFVRFLNHSIRLDSTDRALLEFEFHFTRRIVDSVPAALLSLPNDLSKLHLAHDAIAADLALN